MCAYAHRFAKCGSNCTGVNTQHGASVNKLLASSVLLAAVGGEDPLRGGLKRLHRLQRARFAGGLIRLYRLHACVELETARGRAR